MRIQTRLLTYTTLGFACMAAGIGFIWQSTSQSLEEQTHALIEQQVLATAKGVAHQVAITRKVYVGSIVGALKPHGVGFSATPKDGQAPLPATFVSEIAAGLGNGIDSPSYALRSDWNLNADQGIDTPFEKLAWQFMLEEESRVANLPIEERATAYQPYFEQTTLEDGSDGYLVMTPDLASGAGCVSCHNDLEKTAEVLLARGQTTPKVFKLGDLMGAVVTTVPVSGAQAMTANVIATVEDTGTKIWIALIVGSLLSIGIIILLSRKTIVSPLDSLRKSIGHLAEGQLKLQPVRHNSDDEIGKLSAAFDSLLSNLQAVGTKVDLIANDDFTVSFDEQSDHDQLGKSLNGMIAALNRSGDERAAQAAKQQADEERQRHELLAKETEAERLLAQQEADTEQRLAKQEAEAERIQNAEHAKQAALTADADRDRAEQDRLAATKVEKAASNVGELVRAAANGDLTFSFDRAEDEAIGGVGIGLQGFLESLGERLSTVFKSSREINASSSSLSELSSAMNLSVDDASNQTANASRAADEVNEHVQGIASSAEEMSSSIKEIAKSTSAVSEVTRAAVESASESKVRVDALDDKGEEIGQMIKTIASIASQTNLLALNATIESARAGEAGAGFAVVAGEVKELARETEKAAIQITTLIDAIRVDTRDAVNSITGISKQLVEIDERQGSVASAVEEQHAAMSEISRNATQASSRTGAIAENLNQLSSATASTRKSGATSNELATELSALGSRLEELLSFYQF